jgi:hypothetical protein
LFGEANLSFGVEEIQTRIILIYGHACRLTRSNHSWRAAIHFSFPKQLTEDNAVTAMEEHDEEAMGATRDDNAVAPSESSMAAEKVPAAEVDEASVGNEENRQKVSAEDAASSPKKNDGPNDNNEKEEPSVAGAAPVAVAAGPTTNKNNPLKRPADSISNEAEKKIEEAEETTNHADRDAASSVPMDDDDDDTAKQQPPPPLAPEEPPPVDITKPVKRARTAYLIFADDKRGEVQEKVSHKKR